MIDEYKLYMHTEVKMCEVFKRSLSGAYEKITVEERKKVLDCMGG